MASLSSPGIGTGLDVSGLVSQLVTAAKTAPQNQIDTRRDANGAELSALGSLTSALSALQFVLLDYSLNHSLSALL